MSAPASRDHAWLPRATCDTDCLRAGGYEATRRLIVALRVARRIGLLLLLSPALPLLAGVIPGWSKSRQIYCRMLLWCLGVKTAVAGGPIRNLPGVLVVSDHMSWLDILSSSVRAAMSFNCPAPLRQSQWVANACDNLLGSAEIHSGGFVVWLAFLDHLAKIYGAHIDRLRSRIHRRAVPFDSSQGTRANQNSRGSRPCVGVLDRGDCSLEQHLVSSAIQSIQVAILATCSEKLLARFARIQRRGRAIVVVQPVIGPELVKPFELAGIGIQRHRGIGIVGIALG